MKKVLEYLEESGIELILRTRTDQTSILLAAEKEGIMSDQHYVIGPGDNKTLHFSYDRKKEVKNEIDFIIFYGERARIDFVRSSSNPKTTIDIYTRKDLLPDKLDYTAFSAVDYDEGRIVEMD